MSDQIAVPMQVPLIGQKPKQEVPGVNVGIRVEGDTIAMVTTVIGIIDVKAPMTPEVALQVMMNLGQAIEHVRPGFIAAMQRMSNGQVFNAPR